MWRHLLLSVGLIALPLQGAWAASPDDTARVLAGLPVPAGSPLAALEDTPSWKVHARTLDTAFGDTERTHLASVRAWAKANIPTHRSTLYYMFSGPDYLYANAFFPDETTYILAGLEPVGKVPDLESLNKGVVPKSLGAVRASMRTLLNASYFITSYMSSELQASPLKGTLPVLYVFLARSGKTLHDVSLVYLDSDGKLQTGTAPSGAAKGVKITFSGKDGPEKTLYYFSANLANNGFQKSGFEQFLSGFGEGDAFIKSASYLLHNAEFAQVRSFLLQHSALILQDDTGVPAARFSPEWTLRPFGTYIVPIKPFRGYMQPKLVELFRKAKAPPLGFGLGYHRRTERTSLILALKTGAETKTATPKPEAATPPKTDGKENTTRNP